MGRDLTRRRHGRHRNFDRVRRGGDTLGFLDEQQVRLDSAEGEEGIHDAMHLVQGEDESFSFEDVQVAADPTDIGLTPSFLGQTDSLDFDGTEHLSNDSDILHGFGNVFSIAGWVKPSDVNALRYIFSVVRAGAPDDRERIDIRMGTASTRMDVLMFNGASAVRKNFQWNGVFAASTWVHLLVTWDGTDLFAYINGTFQAVSTKVTDLSITVPAIARRTRIGKLTSSQFWLGRMHSFGMWPVDVGSAASDLYNGGDGTGFDLSTDSGGYTFSADNDHWWRFGHDSGDIGKDSGVGSPLVDVDVNGNMDATDIVVDSPT